MGLLSNSEKYYKANLQNAVLLYRKKMQTHHYKTKLIEWGSPYKTNLEPER